MRRLDETQVTQEQVAAMATWEEERAKLGAIEEASVKAWDAARALVDMLTKSSERPRAYLEEYDRAFTSAASIERVAMSYRQKVRAHAKKRP